jgi:altronate dehydratase large subunit
VPLAERLVRDAAELSREPAPLEALCLGLECGGSDGFSGITANPALGEASDLLVAAGGTSILAETSELIGAEHLLAARAVSPEVGTHLLAVIERFEQSVAALGVDLRGGQPVPGNIEGGLTTIEEKSLGAAKKGGRAPIQGVLEYAVAPHAAGLYVMDTPGNDIEQMVGMVAAGCQIVAFTTGRGTPTGSPIAPCLKIATNSDVFARLRDDIDLDAGAILEGTETVTTMGATIYAALLTVAGGRSTQAERHGNREFAISRIAPQWHAERV